MARGPSQVCTVPVAASGALSYISDIRCGGGHPLNSMVWGQASGGWRGNTPTWLGTALANFRFLLGTWEPQAQENFCGHMALSVYPIFVYSKWPQFYGSRP